MSKCQIIRHFKLEPWASLNSHLNGWIGRKRYDIPSNCTVLDLIGRAWMDLQGDLIVSDGFELLL